MPKSTETLITVNPDGTISADFTGHISAAGIDLLAGTFNAVGVPQEPDRKIRWHQLTLSGPVVGEIDAYEDNTGTFKSAFVTQAAVQTFGNAAENRMEAAASGSRVGRLTLTQLFAAGVAGSKLQLDFDAVPTTFVIGRADGTSEFARKEYGASSTGADLITTANIGVYLAMAHGPTLQVNNALYPASPKAGTYRVSAYGDVQAAGGGAALTEVRVGIFKNGVLFDIMGWFTGTQFTSVITGRRSPFVQTFANGDVITLGVATNNLPVTVSQVSGWAFFLEEIT